MNIQKKYKLNIAKNVAAIGLGAGVMSYSCKKEDPVITPPEPVITQPIDTVDNSVAAVEKREYQALVHKMDSIKAIAIIGSEDMYYPIYNKYLNLIKPSGLLKSSPVLKNELFDIDAVMEAYANMRTIPEMFATYGYPLPPPANSEEMQKLLSASKEVIRKYEWVQQILSLPTQPEIDEALRWYTEEEMCNAYYHPDSIARMDYAIGKCIKTARDPYKQAREACNLYYHPDTIAYWINNKCIKEKRSNIRVFELEAEGMSSILYPDIIKAALIDPSYDSVYIKVLSKYHLLNVAATDFEIRNRLNDIERFISRYADNSPKLKIMGIFNPTLEGAETVTPEYIARIQALGLEYRPGYIPPEYQNDGAFLTPKKTPLRETLQNPINVKPFGNHVASAAVLGKMRKTANARLTRVKNAHLQKTYA